MSGLLYIIRREDGWLKIGHTVNDIGYRVRGERFRSGQKVELVCTVPGTRSDEKCLHATLRRFRTPKYCGGAARELFDLPPNVEAALIEAFKTNRVFT